MLTALLRQREDVANELASLVTYRPNGNALPLQAWPMTTNYALVGTAFDYLLRWELERRNHAARDGVWVATTAVDSILPVLPPAWIDAATRSLYFSVHEEAKFFHDRWFGLESVSTHDLTLAARHVLTLAKIDPLYRTGAVDPSVNVYDPKDVADVEALFRIVPWGELGDRPHTTPILNPSFGSVSKRFRGADADLVVDGPDGTMLVDFKTSKYNDIAKHLAQLVGYGMIIDLYQAEGNEVPPVDVAGIYWARHGYLDTFDFRVVREHPGYAAARDRLLAAADEMTRVPVRHKLDIDVDDLVW